MKRAFTLPFSLRYYSQEFELFQKVIDNAWLYNCIATISRTGELPEYFQESIKLFFKRDYRFLYLHHAVFDKLAFKALVELDKEASAPSFVFYCCCTSG